MVYIEVKHSNRNNWIEREFLEEQIVMDECIVPIEIHNMDIHLEFGKRGNVHRISDQIDKYILQYDTISLQI